MYNANVTNAFFKFTEIASSDSIKDIKLLFDGDAVPSSYVRDPRDLNGGLGPIRIYMAYSRSVEKLPVKSIKLSPDNFIPDYESDNVHILRNGLKLHIQRDRTGQSSISDLQVLWHHVGNSISDIVSSSIIKYPVVACKVTHFNWEVNIAAGLKSYDLLHVMPADNIVHLNSEEDYIYAMVRSHDGFSTFRIKSPQTPDPKKTTEINDSHLYVDYGAIIKMEHIPTKLKLFSCENVNYSTGTGGQHVACCAGDNLNHSFIIKSVSGASGPIINGAVVKLQHFNTKKYIKCTFGVPSPHTKQQEISCSLESDISDNSHHWKVEIVTAAATSKFLLGHPDMHFILLNLKNPDVALHSHGLKNGLGVDYQEVTGLQVRDPNDWWCITSFDNPSIETTEVALKSKEFLQRTIGIVFKQLSVGCGVSSCTNSNCCSNPEIISKSPTESAVLAINLVTNVGSDAICTRHMVVAKAMKQVRAINSYSIATECINLALKYVENILLNLEDPKFKRIKCLNPIFNQRIWTIKGGPELMASIGFEKEIVDLPDSSETQVFLVLREEVKPLLSLVVKQLNL